MKKEKNILVFSALGCFFFAAFGLGWGMFIKSSMIMFDGLYSFISLFLSLLAIWITNYIDKSDFERFPFGKGILEPMTVALKSIVLVVMCSITFLNGAKELFGGGADVDTGKAVLYAIISSVGCAIMYFNIKNRGKKLSSDILKAEGNQWLMDTVLSVAVLVGFVISFILSKTSLAHLTSYVDPAMVVISSAIFIKVPIASLVSSFKEVVNSKADKEINERVYTIVKGIEEDYNFEESITRVSKIGRELRIEIDFVFNEDTNLYELDEMDKVREKVNKGLSTIKLEKWMNINFTGDKKWAL